MNIIKPVAGEWDQPPSYPNVAQAVDQAIEASKKEYKNQFFSIKSMATPVAAATPATTAANTPVATAPAASN